MELSLDQFVDLLRRFEANPEPQDVRRTARIAMRRQVTIITDPIAGTETEMVLQDISRGGISMTHHEGMPRDKRFVLVLPMPGERQQVMCVVRHCQMIKHHLFKIGAQFEAAEESEVPPVGA
jgi:hypothetical protein